MRRSRFDRETSGDPMKSFTAGSLAMSACICFAAPAQDSAPPTAPAIIPISSKLDIDPTEKLAITGWWSNGKQVFVIEKNGAFVMWDQPNRFRKPSRSGRWDRQNYRTFFLEPYVLDQHENDAPKRIRAAMRRTDGVVMVDLPESLGFVRTVTPPPAPEDAYCGTWSGPGGVLDLSADGSYIMLATPSTGTSSAPVRRVAQRGTWSFDAKYIQLQAESGAGSTTACAPMDSKDPYSDAITSPLGELRRTKPKPAGALSPVSPAPTAPPAPNSPATPTP